MVKFKKGEHYATRSICDHDCIFRFEVTDRSEKTVTVKSVHGTARRKIRVHSGAECIMPLGTYSMAPLLTAIDLEATLR